MSSVLRTIRIMTIICLSSTLLIACGAGGGLSAAAEATTSTAAGQQAASPEEAGEEATGITKSLRLAWAAPATRLNGEDMSLAELAGYEIQYRKVGEVLFTSTIINSPYTLEHTLTRLESGDYEIQMASFDTDQQYSQFSDRATVTL